MEKSKALRIQSGHRYGYWTITGDAQRINRDLRYPCQCVCGTQRLVSAITLRNGSSTNCGCLAKQNTQKISVSDHHGLSAEVQEILKLISKGILPPADQFSIKDGSPSWTLPTIARRAPRITRSFWWILPHNNDWGRIRLNFFGQ